MKNSDMLRHQIIKSLMAQHTEKVADVAIGLWERMATQIVSIVGESGFNSLYARSVFLMQPKFPWLATCLLSPQTDHRFTGLTTCFEGQMPEQVSEANILLLITFTDILAVLIGEQLTTSILRLAWGDNASDSADKEF